MATCREIFTFSWPLRGRGGGGSTQAVSLTAFSQFFLWWLPLLLSCKKSRSPHWALLCCHGVLLKKLPDLSIASAILTHLCTATVPKRVPIFSTGSLFSHGSLVKYVNNQIVDMYKIHVPDKQIHINKLPMCHMPSVESFKSTQLTRVERERERCLFYQIFIHPYGFVLHHIWRLSGSCMVNTDHLPAAPGIVLLHPQFHI